MVLGGLRPIASRLALDAVALLLLGYCTVSSIDSPANTMALLAAALLTVSTADFTNRWTVTFPMVPILVLQSLRRIPLVSETKWANISIAVFTGVFLFLIFALSLLFPAVELPLIEGKYRVGMISLHVPVDLSKVEGKQVETDSHVAARILYPTLEQPDKMPYLDPSTAADLCEQYMAMGAPSFMKKSGWILHNWRLIHLDVKHNASPIDSERGLPVVVYSHGLGGSPAIYSYQTHSLAANGYIVLAIEHSDGSAALTKKRDGTIQRFDTDIGQLWADGKEVEYVRQRRARTDHRVREFLGATLSLLELNVADKPGLCAGISFKNRIDTKDVHFMGHSFGGATALTAGVRRPDLVVSIVAHEPVLDWMPDDARRSLLDPERIEGAPVEYSGGTGGYESELNSKDNPPSVHDKHMLFLYSDEWKSKNWGGCDILEHMHQEGKLGRRGSDFGVVLDSCHNEFSDTSKLTPVWLGRMVGVTGKRSPLDTGAEIRERTLAFLESVRSGSS